MKLKQGLRNEQGSLTIYFLEVLDKLVLYLIGNFTLGANQQQKISSTNLDLNKANFNRIKADLSTTDWYTQFAYKNAKECYELLTEVYYNLCEKHIPKKKLKTNLKRNTYHQLYESSLRKS